MLYPQWERGAGYTGNFFFFVKSFMLEHHPWKLNWDPRTVGSGIGVFEKCSLWFYHVSRGENNCFLGPRKGLNIRILSNVFQAIEYGAQFELHPQGLTHGILTLSRGFWFTGSTIHTFGYVTSSFLALELLIQGPGSEKQLSRYLLWE